jgi:basic membrane protein A and related proteins
MKPTTFRLALLAVVGALLIGACAPAATPTPEVMEVTQEVTRIVEGTPVVEQVVVTATAPPATAEPAFRVALVTPSGINDLAFSQSMYEAILKVQEDMGGPDKLELAYSENLFQVPDAAAAIRDYADQGYDLIIAHGSQYGAPLTEVAPDFPDTSFAWGTTVDTFQSKGINNVFAYTIAAEQGGYVFGTIGALMSKTGTLGFCGPVEIGEPVIYLRGIKAGAEAAKPGTTINVAYTGSFGDVSLMAACAETEIAAGADVLAGSSQSVVGAIGVVKDQGAYWFGNQWDQTSLAPGAVIANQVYDWSGPVKDMIAAHKAGVMGGKVYTLTITNGGLQIVYNDQVSLPDDVKAAADAAVQGLTDGSITP